MFGEVHGESDPFAVFQPAAMPTAAVVNNLIAAPLWSRSWAVIAGRESWLNTGRGMMCLDYTPSTCLEDEARLVQRELTAWRQ